MNLLNETIGDITPAESPPLRAEIQRRLDRLTKPRGSLGRLEEIAVRYGLARAQTQFELPRKTLFVFCADHGVTAAGVSAYPPEVTRQMVLNFVSGGAAINVLCRQHGIDPLIVDMGVNGDFDPALSIINRKVAHGTRNFLDEPAMSAAQAVQAVETGITLALAAAKMDYGLLAVGEMGIGNTTAAGAVAAAISGRDPAEVVGTGSGINQAQREHKVAVIRQALEKHHPEPCDPLAVLAAVGGFEIGGMAGFLLGAARRRLPVVVDGFIASCGALLAARLSPAAADYLFFSHRSAEPGHQVVLDLLDAKPLLALEMRLGEGTGAALAVGLIESALRLYLEMATFESAGVSDRAPEAG